MQFAQGGPQQLRSGSQCPVDPRYALGVVRALAERSQLLTCPQHVLQRAVVQMFGKVATLTLFDLHHVVE